MKDENADVFSGRDERLTAAVKDLSMTMPMQATAISLLRNIEGACDTPDLERTITFANGYTLGLDRDHVSEQDVSKLQGIYLEAYEARRDELAAA